MIITHLTHRLIHLAVVAAAIASVTTLAHAQPRATYEVVSSFPVAFINGTAPSSLLQEGDGTFYGTTAEGGLYDQGVIFRIDPDGTVTTLHHFTGNGADRGKPSTMVKAMDGQFYGLTAGTVFRFTPGVGVTTLHTFAPVYRSPLDLVAAGDGNLYGVTMNGGDVLNGAIFKVEPSGTVTFIYSLPFTIGNRITSLIRGSDGQFYGTAERGGDSDWGTVFTIDGAGTARILHSFAGLADGGQPAGVTQGRDGRLYGMTRDGGQRGDGTVYSIDPSGADYRVLGSLESSVESSNRTLLEAEDGHFYGMTSQSLIELNASGTISTLNRLTNAMWSVPPHLGLLRGIDGRLFVLRPGSILARDTSGLLSAFHEFPVGEGIVGRPNGVIQSRDGQFYGTTLIGSIFSNPSGTVFRMDANGARTTLHAITAEIGERTAGEPQSTLFEDADGGLLGTTLTGDPEGFFNFPPGQVYRVAPAGNYTIVARAYGMQAGVIRARDGRLYVPTINTRPDDLSDFGGILRIEPSGAATVIHTFDSTTGNGSAELLEANDGMLYGTTRGGWGTVFRLDPVDGSFDVVYRFSRTDGSMPTGRLLQGSNGLIYGTTTQGGAYGGGTVFALDPAGTLTTLHHFSGLDGASPNGVIEGADGRLYGTTRYGGTLVPINASYTTGYGTVFALNLTGGLTTLHEFTFSDGANPVSEMIQAADGALYGAAPMGGPLNSGVIFRVRLETAPPPTDGYFQIVSRNSGKCLDIYGASTDLAAQAIQWTCHGGANQQWRLEPAGGGAYRIIARHSGQALDVFGASVDDLASIIQWPVNGGDNQSWTLEPTTDGYVRIVARHSGKAMDVEYASTDDGARVIQYAPHGNANQQWLLRPAQ